MEIKILKGGRTIIWKWRTHWASLSLAAGSILKNNMQSELMAYFPCDASLSVKKCKWGAKKLHIVKKQTSFYHIQDVWGIVMVTAEAPTRPRSWWETVLIGCRACLCTSWHRLGQWGWWCHLHWSPARPPGSDERSTQPGNRADPGPVCCQLGEFSWFSLSRS